MDLANNNVPVWFINYNKCTELMENVNNRGNCMWVGGEEDVWRFSGLSVQYLWKLPKKSLKNNLLP